MDKFTIISDRSILEERSLLPDSWQLTLEAINAINGLQPVRIELTELEANNWPAQSNRALRTIRIDQSFFNDRDYERDEVLATILHEVGHLLEPAKCKSLSPVDYIAVMSGDEVAESEFYADQFASKAGFSEALVSVLRKLSEDERFTAETKFGFFVDFCETSEFEVEFATLK